MLQQSSKPPGSAPVRLSNSAYVECIDFRVASAGEETNLVQLRESLISDWNHTSDGVHSNESLACLGFSPNLAPFSVFPFEPALCVDLLIGAKAYMVLLNVTAVARESEHRGWKVVTTPKQVFGSGRLAEDFMTVSKDGFYFTLPPAAFMRMQMELPRNIRPEVWAMLLLIMRKLGYGFRVQAIA